MYCQFDTVHESALLLVVALKEAWVVGSIREVAKITAKQADNGQSRAAVGANCRRVIAQRLLREHCTITLPARRVRTSVRVIDITLVFITLVLIALGVVVTNGDPGQQHAD